MFLNGKSNLEIQIMHEKNEKNKKNKRNLFKNFFSGRVRSLKEKPLDALVAYF